MRKNRLLALSLATMVSAGAVVGLTSCTAGMDPQLKDKTILNIVMPDLGYGTDQIALVAENFTKKTGTRVNLDVTPTETGYGTALSAGTAPYDIYLMRANPHQMVVSNAANMTDNEVILLEIDDVYESQVGNEVDENGQPLLFKDKMKDSYEIYNRIYKTPTDEETGNHHYYSIQWCDSNFSIVRNMNVWQESWGEFPVTTDGLLALCETIKSDKSDPEGYTPFIYSDMASDYWWSSGSMWITQYQGLEDMYGEKGFWRGYDEAGNRYKPEMWARNGIKEGLRVLNDLVQVKMVDGKQYSYQHVLSATINFTQAQGYFLIDSNNIAMMANGDWLYNEMKKNYENANLKMEALPVISAIRKHPACENTIANDAELTALIKAIDAGSTSLTGEGYDVSQSAFDKVYEARNMYTCGSQMNHIMVSPYNTDSADLVKQFYNYLATEEGQVSFATGSHGFTHCFEETEAVYQAAHLAGNDFARSSEAIKYSKQVAPWPMYMNRLFSVGGMSTYPIHELGYSDPIKIFSIIQSGSNSGYMTADEVFTKNYQNVKEKWSSYMLAAGL